MRLAKRSWPELPSHRLNVLTKFLPKTIAHFQSARQASGLSKSQCPLVRTGAGLIVHMSFGPPILAVLTTRTTSKSKLSNACTALARVDGRPPKIRARCCGAFPCTVNDGFQQKQPLITRPVNGVSWSKAATPPCVSISAVKPLQRLPQKLPLDACLWFTVVYVAGVIPWLQFEYGSLSRRGDRACVMC